MDKKEIYLAGGCFWGTEHFVKLIPGVIETEVGYANGHTPDPTYKEVCTDTTGYAETVRVVYDAERLSLDRLLELYLMTIDPTSLNRQGGDVGTQYRTGIYFTNEADRIVIEKALTEIAKDHEEDICVECCPLDVFYSAEDYHQDYLDKNPTGYCHLSPALFEIARKG